MEINGLPVVSVADGEALADVKDIVYDPDRGSLVGFTLNKRGFLKGPMKAVLPISSVASIGRDAVMVAATDACEEKGSGAAAEVSSGAVGNVVGNDVLTDAGRRLGKVTDIVVAADSGDVLGYELEGDERLQGHAARPRDRRALHPRRPLRVRRGRRRVPVRAGPGTPGVIGLRAALGRP